MTTSFKVESVTRVRLNRGGYDSDGQYFGQGAPLFRIWLDNGKLGHVRAASAKEARKLAVADPYKWGFRGFGMKHNSEKVARAKGREEIYTPQRRGFPFMQAGRKVTISAAVSRRVSGSDGRLYEAQACVKQGKKGYASGWPKVGKRCGQGFGKSPTHALKDALAQLGKRLTQAR